MCRRTVCHFCGLWRACRYVLWTLPPRQHATEGVRRVVYAMCSPCRKENKIPKSLEYSEMFTP